MVLMWQQIHLIWINWLAVYSFPVWGLVIDLKCWLGRYSRPLTHAEAYYLQLTCRRLWFLRYNAAADLMGRFGHNIAENIRLMKHKIFITPLALCLFAA